MSEDIFKSALSTQVKLFFLMPNALSYKKAFKK